MPFISGGGSGGGGVTLGRSLLIYRFTVSGSDKLSIDTGVDVAQAGANDWTNGDLLEVFLSVRTDEAVVPSQVNVVLNNDTGNNYDVVRVQGLNGATATSSSLARANFFFDGAGASAPANAFATAEFKIPNYTGTTGLKAGNMSHCLPSQAALTMEQDSWALGYRSTSALTRLAVSVNTGGAKLKVGSQLLIYKRQSV
jgi:hypothetical protein